MLIFNCVLGVIFQLGRWFNRVFFILQSNHLSHLSIEAVVICNIYSFVSEVVNTFFHPIYLQNAVKLQTNMYNIINMPLLPIVCIGMTKDR